MGYFIAAAVNPNPATNSNDRQYLALSQSGIILPSHGLSVPVDTPNQPARPYISGAPGNWSTPRFGWPNAYLRLRDVIGNDAPYAADVAIGIVVTDWTPDDVSGYVGDNYGALWPFGSKTPIAATGLTGAPFGLAPFSTTQVFNGFQMHSANGLPFGPAGGYPDGFGWFISMDGVIVGWGGPVSNLAQPWSNLGGVGLSGDGTVGQGLNCVRDFKVNPDGSGEYYVLFESGYVFNGGPPGKVVSSAQPSPSNVSMATPNGFRFMHVEWGKWIISFKADGTPWGYNITGNGGENYPPLPAPVPWLNASGGPPPGVEGYWQDGDLIPAQKPTHLWLFASTGGVGSQVIVGTVSISGLALASSTTTTEPTITWTYAETLGVPQASYSVRVYLQSYITAQGGAFVPGQQAGTEDGWINDHNSATPSDKVNRNLKNGVAYVAYVRAKSAADVWTAWSSFTFTLAIPVPATPSSCTTTLHQGTYPGLGTIDITAGGGAPPAGTTLQFQVSAAGGPFVDVWGAEATSSTTVTDRWPSTNVTLVYRVRAVKRVPGVVASVWRTSAPVVLLSSTGTPSGWRFIDVGPGGAGPTVIVPIDVDEGPDFERTEPRGEFQPMTQTAQTVTTGGVKGAVHNITVWSLDATTYVALYNLLSQSRPMLFQNVFGRQWWVRPTPGTWKMQLLQPQAAEVALGLGVRDANKVTLRLVEVNPPR